MATSAAIVAEPALSQPRALASLPILLCVVASAKLRMECGDDRSARILEDFGRLIAVSERMCEDAEAHPENDAAEYVIDAETEYVEELIGSVFLVLQTASGGSRKARRPWTRPWWRRVTAASPNSRTTGGSSRSRAHSV
jgi:hypothetical protein